MGSLVVVPMLEPVEELLLSAEVCSGGPSRLSLQVLVHAFVLAVLLRARRLDPLMDDAQLHPPPSTSELLEKA